MATQDTHQKALAINLDPTVFGTLAEIGAGQEVARWFLQVGGASGTVAKTVSAYDMAFSDAMYGRVGRYVSRERLEGMLAHEYPLLIERLAAKRGATTRFFVFADTVSARNFAGTNECHGWVGLRFQAEPGAQPSDVVLHVNLRDPTNLLQQQAVGILGVNLIDAAFNRRVPLEAFLAALLDELTPARIEVDLIAMRGPAFGDIDERSATLELVRQGLAEAGFVPADAGPVPPSEVIRKRPLVLEPGVFATPEPVHASMLDAARTRLAAEIGPQEGEPVACFVLTMNESLWDAVGSTATLNDRVDALHRLGAGVLVARRPELYQVARYALRYTTEPVRFIIGALTVAEVFHARHYHDLDGALLEALAHLFAANVRMYVHPMPPPRPDQLHHEVAAWVGPPRADGLVGLEQLQIPRPISHLFDYLVESGFLCPIEPESTRGGPPGSTE